MIINPNGEDVNTIYYVSNVDYEDIVIYGEKPSDADGVITLPRLFLNYYFIIAILLSCVFTITLFLVRKKQRIKAILIKMLFVPISYTIAHIAIAGFNAISYSATRDFYLILLLSIPMYGLIYLLYKKAFDKECIHQSLSA